MRSRGLAKRAVDRWVSLYTFALPPDIAAERRKELRSHLWEQHAAGSRGLDLIRRAVAGMPADLVWRVSKGIVAPWIRPALRLAASAALLFSLAVIQHQGGRHTLIGNATYASWFVVAFAAVGAAVIGAWRRFLR